MSMRQYFDKLEQVISEVDIFEAKRDKMMSFMDICPALCFIKEVHTGKYLYVNESIKLLLGRELIGYTDVDIFSPEDAKRYMGHDVDVISKNGPIQLIETLTLNGKQRTFLMTKFIIQNGERCIGGIALPLPDVVKIKKEESKGSKK